MHIFLPQNLNEANRFAVNEVTDQMFPLILKSETRDILLFAFPHRRGCGDMLRLIDIPTTMGAIEESVRIRANVDIDRTSYPWGWLERQEFNRFLAVLEKLKNSDATERARFEHHAKFETTFDIKTRLDAGGWQL